MAALESTCWPQQHHRSSVRTMLICLILIFPCLPDTRRTIIRITLAACPLCHPITTPPTQHLNPCRGRTPTTTMTTGHTRSRVPALRSRRHHHRRPFHMHRRLPLQTTLRSLRHRTRPVCVLNSSTMVFSFRHCIISLWHISHLQRWHQWSPPQTAINRTYRHSTVVCASRRSWRLGTVHNESCQCPWLLPRIRHTKSRTSKTSPTLAAASIVASPVPDKVRLEMILPRECETRLQMQTSGSLPDACQTPNLERLTSLASKTGASIS